MKRCVVSITGIGSGQEIAGKRRPAIAVAMEPPRTGEWLKVAGYVKTAMVMVASLFVAQCPRAQPQADYHQHLFSPKIAKLAPGLNPFTAADLIALLDKAGIRRAVVLSIAYQYSSANRPPIEDEYAKVKEENDWTSQQVAHYPEPGYGEWEKKAELIAQRIRQLGTMRVLFGSDGFGGGNLAPVDAWAAFRQLPLSDDEFRVIETNTAPYMR